ncbi:MAG TPA: RidA family protein [Trebonia sp.]
MPRDQGAHNAHSAVANREDIDPAADRAAGRPETPRQRGGAVPHVRGPSSSNTKPARTGARNGRRHSCHRSIHGWRSSASSCLRCWPRSATTCPARVGSLLFVGGHGPVSADEVVIGKVGSSLSLAAGQRAARLTALSILATMRAELGDLDRAWRFVKVFGMVNVAPGFDQTPAVIDGCSDLLVDVFGDRGRHTRTAVGLAELPHGIAVEIELTAEIA